MQNYIAGMEKAGKATRETASEAEKLAKTKADFDLMGRTMLGAGAAVAAGLGVAIHRFSEFDAAMSNVQAATGESAAGLELLADAAIESGARTVYSATEAANAIEELGKAGVSTADILSGGLDASLDLAAAGGLEVADAAGIAAVALKTFNLEGEDMGHVADLLAAGAGKAMGEVSDLSAALNQSGQVAASTGLSIDETTAALAAFASQGLLGSDAGTSFKTMLGALTPNSAKAAEEMKRLGISAYDASGNFVGLEQFAGNLQNAMKDLTPQARSAAMEVIFGSDAVRAANILYSEGATGIAEWTQKVDDTGYASRTAATKLDNLRGDVEALGGAFDSALIQSGSYANDMLRSMTQGLTALVNVFGDLPGPVQGTAVAIGAVAASIGLVGGTAILAVPKLAEFRGAMATTGLSMKTMSLYAVSGGVALAGLGAIITALAADQAEARQKTESYATTLEKGTLKVTKATRDMAKENLAARDSFLWIERESAYDAAEKLGISLDLVTDAAMGNVDAMKELNVQLEAANDGSFELGNAYATINEKVKGESASLEDAIRVAEQKNKVTEESVEVTKDSATAYLDAAGEVDGLTSKLQDLLNQMNELNGVGQDAVSANLRYRDTLATVQQAIADGAHGLDENTEAGRDNKSMLLELAEQSQDAAEAQFDLDKNTDAYRTTLEAGRQALIDSAIQMGATTEEAEALADQIYQIPSEKEIDILADTSAAITAMSNLWARYDGRVITIKTAIGTAGYNAATDSLVPGRAAGGAIHGPGSGTSDTAGLYALSNGEHVLTAADVAAMGGQHAVYAFRDGLHGGAGASGSSSPSLEGASISGVLEIGGDGLGRIIDGRISFSNAERDRNDNAGRRRFP